MGVTAEWGPLIHREQTCLGVGTITMYEKFLAQARPKTNDRVEALHGHRPMLPRLSTAGQVNSCTYD
ncbi:hypothetical protein ACFWFQ_30260 [Nocardia salmonicida]|uniref:hypothetical protein n=1 Tax=Nocardia salmonicida TaxID=53431 RepID=UPI0036691878